MSLLDSTPGVLSAQPTPSLCIPRQRRTAWRTCKRGRWFTWTCGWRRPCAKRRPSWPRLRSSSACSCPEVFWNWRCEFWFFYFESKFCIFLLLKGWDLGHFWGVNYTSDFKIYFYKVHLTLKVITGIWSFDPTSELSGVRYPGGLPINFQYATVIHYRLFKYIYL